ncbi:MAG: 7-cyano-7-deazaguanine synthase QueC [Candidatus Margulisbacteria bacterium]|nr:7-cyano-7-deazaguanine synthase QueC [Candidatus Margulisiibacteriota bacterium]
MKKAIILLSGGLDSTTTLYYALSKSYKCSALIFDYNQRHRKEIRHAVAIAKELKVHYHIIKINLPWKGSSLLDKQMKVPTKRSVKKMSAGIPSTYVSARNTIFLSFALSYAEVEGAEAIFIGANAIDYSGYPDCRPSYFRAFQKAAYEGTKVRAIKIIAPLIKLSKAEIVKLAKKLNVPIDRTWSCYLGDKKPCGVCDSCQLRAKGLE